MGALFAAFNINWQTLLAQVINFVILFGLLYLIAYKPVMRMLDRRSGKIKESIDQAESIKEQSAQAEENIKKRMEVANKDAQERIAQATRISGGIKQKAQEETKQEAKILLNRARIEIQRERDDAVGELRKEFADLTIMAAEKVIDRSLDKEAHKKLIDKVLEESSAPAKE
ncbi:F0F1 ATP synthase subunit B [Chloroflexota bacterium]